MLLIYEYCMLTIRQITLPWECMTSTAVKSVHGNIEIYYSAFFIMYNYHYNENASLSIEILYEYHNNSTWCSNHELINAPPVH